MKNFALPGNKIDWVNDSGVDKVSGDVVLIQAANPNVGVLEVDIADTKNGTVATKGVFDLAKDGAFAPGQGDLVAWDDIANDVVAGGTGTFDIGYAWISAVAADPTVLVKLVEP